MAENSDGARSGTFCCAETLHTAAGTDPKTSDAASQKRRENTMHKLQTISARQRTGICVVHSHRGNYETYVSNGALPNSGSVHRPARLHRHFSLLSARGNFTRP